MTKLLNVIGVLFEAEDTTASVLTWILKYLEDDHKLLEAIKTKQYSILVISLSSYYLRDIQFSNVRKGIWLRNHTYKETYVEDNIVESSLRRQGLVMGHRVLFDDRA
ncbi:hypothetical protein JHK82_052774 [Glycine max]|nr:hypothetical protein JHK86_052624 [Glycine max]KAG4926990.1 hypothetical protein JHK85_053476 [Glycine max]KAG5082618.1 hypothetical protein JHK84_052656 [Glycine max]KAG5085377.1 hypothetical protein JHK82_052774 [Glycine max]